MASGWILGEFGDRMSTLSNASGRVYLNTIDPGVSEAGAEIGNLWVNTTTPNAFVNVDATPGSQVWESVGGTPGIITINGDNGSITGSTVTIYANNASNNCGSSVAFVNSGTTSTLNVTDANNNTMIGVSSGNATPGTNNTALGRLTGNLLTSGNGNCFFGQNAGALVTTGSSNVIVGYTAGNTTTGSFNVLLGDQAGASQAGTESSDIYIGYLLGVNGESHTLRIGNGTGTGSGQLNKAFICGITGASPVSANTPQVVLCDNANNLTTISSSNAGYVLTSNGTATPSFQVLPGSVTTINGDSGSITGATVTIYTNNAANANGSTVEFINSGTTSLLQITDANNNTLIGIGAGNATQTGNTNVGIGQNCMGSLTNGASNSGYGCNSLNSITSGSGHVAIGYASGLNWTTENFNIAIGGGEEGKPGESNTIRIGSYQGTSGFPAYTSCFIGGIASVATSNSEYVTIDTTSGQLGSVPIVSPVFLPWTDVVGGSQTMVANNGYTANSAGLTTFTLPLTAAYGTLFAVVGKGAGGWTIVENTGQSINFASITTTPTTGSLSSTAQFNVVYLLTTVADTTFTVIQSIGNLTWV